MTSVTLKLKPDQSERLALAMLEGKVVLALRNQGDGQDSQTSGIRLTSLLPGAAEQPKPAAKPAAAAPAAAKGESIELIKGTKRQQQAM